jgi:hypothetical protein
MGYGPSACRPNCIAPYCGDKVLDFNEQGSVALVMLRLPLLVADTAICILLLGWLRVRVRDVALA